MAPEMALSNPITLQGLLAETKDAEEVGCFFLVPEQGNKAFLPYLF